jgi:hypothetical protein
MPDGIGWVKRDHITRLSAAQMPGTEYSELGT